MTAPDVSSSNLSVVIAEMVNVPTGHGRYCIPPLIAGPLSTNFTGPYYINGELIRSNITEGQAGVPLTLDIGFLDTSTCQPFTDAISMFLIFADSCCILKRVKVDLWHANSTGYYSSYDGTGPGGGSGSIGGSSGSGEASQSAGMSMSGGPGSMSGGAMPTGSTSSNSSSGTSGGSGSGGMSTATSSTTYFLRGAQAIGSNGIAEFETIFPGYCKLIDTQINPFLDDWRIDSGRTTHIHLMVHENATQLSNG